MKAQTILQLVASICGFVGFGLSISQGQPNGFALAAGLYALGYFVQTL